MNSRVASRTCAAVLLIAGLPMAGFGQWQAIGPRAIPWLSGPPGAGKLEAFAVNFADPQVMYTGAGVSPGGGGPYAQSGIFKTTDGGHTWMSANIGLTDPMVNALWLNQANPDILLAGAWFDGIFRSTDAGAHWMQVRAGSTMAFGQSGPALYAATSDGIVESLDVGATWVLIKPTTAPVLALAASGNTLYAGLENGDVLLQATPTSSWQIIMSNSTWSAGSIAVDPTSPQIAYVVYTAPDEPTKLYATFNSGSSWTLLSPPGYAGGASVLAVDDSGTLYSGYDMGINVSTNHGVSWSQMPGAAWDIRFLMPWPDYSGKLIVGSDQGLYLTSNGGSSWVGLNGQISCSLLTGLAVSGSTVLAAAQDYSPMVTFDAGVSWQQSWFNPGSTLPVGEDGIVRLNPGNPNYAYAYTTAGFQYSRDGGHIFSFVPTLPSSEFTFNGSHDMISVDAMNPSIVYVVAKSGIFKSSDWGATWTKQPWPFTNLSLVVVSPADSQTIFVGTQGPGLYITHDGGITWSNNKLGGTVGYPLALDIDPNNPNTIAVGLSAPPATGGGVLLSKDGGNTFAKANSGLAANSASLYPVYVWAISFNPSSTNGVVALATANGAYLSAAPGMNWTNISGNAVPKQFMDLAWAGANLYAATFGQGVIRLLLPLEVSSLSVSPANALSVSGNQGGPFNPSLQQYSVSNNGAGMLKWAASADQSWVTVNPANGQNAGTVLVSINNNADYLPGSPDGTTYSATVTFGSNGGSSSRQVQLTVYSKDTLSAYANTVLADQPLVYYRFEEAAGNIAVDASTNGFHGLYANVGHATTRGSFLGRAAVFNGTNSSVTVPALTKFGQGTLYHQVTIEAWINVNTFVNPDGLECLYNHDGWSLGSMHTHVGRNSQWWFSVNSNSPTDEAVGSSALFSPYTWYHLVAVYDADAKSLSRYVNGRLITNTTYSVAAPVDLGAGHIGAWNGTWRFFNGAIDELAIYGRALLPAQITAHYRAALPALRIVDQSRSQTVSAGTNVILTVTANGALPFDYQWWRNGVLMAGATNATLMLTNAQPKNSGTYWVVVTNATASVTNTRARIMINYPSSALFPIELMGWNRDVVAENAATRTAQFFDMAKFGDVWREAGLAGEEAGLPQNRRFTSAANTNVNFELQPYTTNNALWLSPATGLKSATLELAVPRAYLKLALASASAFGATTTNQAYAYGHMVLHFADGTDSALLKYLTLDWYDYFQQHNAPLMALAGVGFTDLSTSPGWLFGAGCGVGLYETDLDLAAMGLAAKQLTSITFTGVTNNPTGNPETTAIFALSGQPTPSSAFINMVKLSDGNFAFHSTGLPGQVAVLLTTFDLTPPVAWIPVATNIVDMLGDVTFSDLQATNYPQRFYQIKQK